MGFRNANEGFTNIGIAEAGGLGLFLQDIKNLKLRAILLVEVEFPSGTQYFSTTSVRFNERLYKGGVINVSPFRRAIQQNLGLFETTAVSVSFADVDQELINMADADQIKGVKVTFKLGSQSLPYDSFQTIFEGFIDDFGVRNFVFSITVKDKMWTMPSTPNTGTVNVIDFPSALPAHVGLPLPVCYGSHSFIDSSDPNAVDYKLRGAWPTLYVDVQDLSRTFLIACHAVKAIHEVYAYTNAAGSQLLTLTTDYVPHVAGTINGQTMAYIILTDTGFAKLVDGNTIGVLTVNVDGKEAVGDGSGSLIEDPIDCIADFFENYLEDPEINATLFASANAISIERGYIVVGGYTEEKQTAEVLKDICDSFNIRLFPDINGKVAVSIFDNPDTSDLISINDQWEILRESWEINYSSDIQGAEDSQIVNSVDYNYGYHFAGKIFRGSGKRDQSTSQAVYGVKKLNMKLPWSNSALAAGDVSGRLVTLYQNPVASFQCEVPLVGLLVELGDVIKVSHPDAPGGGFVDRIMEIIEIAFNPSTMTVSLRGKDVVDLERGSDYYLDDEDDRIRVQNGTVAVTNSSNVVTFTGASNLLSAGVSVGDIISIPTPTNEANRINVKITEVTDANHIRVDNTVWVNESGMAYKIKPSWLTATVQQKRRGHLADENTGQFSNGDEGFNLL